MAGVDDYLSQFVAPPAGAVVTAPVTPQAQPDPAAVQQITDAAGNPSQALITNLSMDRGNSLTGDNPVLNDFNTMSAWDFQNKYGVDTLSDMGRISKADQFTLGLQNTDRTTGEHIGDALSGVVKGGVGAFADAGTLVAGALSREAGRVAASSTQDFRDWMDTNTQSDANQRNRYLSGMRSELDAIDNDKQYAKDRENKSPFMAGLSYLGRGLVNGAYQLAEDPQSLETGISEGVGSLLAAGPLARTVGVAGRLAGMGKAATETLVPAAVGLMEGGSAYSGALQQVMGMSNEELLKNSPTFRNLVAGGMDPDKAKEQTASRAAETAAAIQGPLAAVSGKLVAAFEAHPVGAKGFRDMVKNIVNETVEEGAQSATGQAAQNLGIQQTANENQSLLQGVGEQTAQGAILGGLTAGIVQAPTTPVVALNSAIDAIKASGNKITTANNNASGVTDADLSAAATTLKDTVAPISEAVDTAAQTVPAEIKTEIGVNSLKTRLENTVNLTDDDYRNAGPAVFDAMQAANMPAPQNKQDLILSLARVAKAEDLPIEARQGAALYLTDLIDRSDKLFNEDLNEVMSSMDQASPEYEGIKNFQSLVDSLKSSSNVMDTVNWLADNAKLNISDNGPVDPQTVQNAIRATNVAPSSLGSQGARTVLKQADEGTISVTPEQRKALQNTAITMEIADQAQVAIQQTKEDPNQDLTANALDVGDQVMRRGRENGWALSYDQHIGRVNSAIQQGDNDSAGAALRNMGNFARSQMNKANAWVRSAREGGTQTYTPVGPYGRNLSQAQVTYHANSPASKATARRIAIEANMLIDQFNALADANPELGIARRLDRVEQIPEFFGAPVADVVQQSEPVKEVSNPVVEQSTAVSEPVQAEEVKDAKFPFLVKPKDVENRFLQAFNTEKTGRYLDYGEPLVELAQALDTVETEGMLFNADQTDALKDYLRKGWQLIYSDNGGLAFRFRNFMNSSFNKEFATFRDALDAGHDVAGLARAHSIALLEKTGDRYQYNPALVQTAMLAALNWFAQSQNRTAYLDRDAVAKLTGLDPSAISNKTVDMFNSGVGLTQAARSLAEEITKFWGMSTNKDAPENLAKGIPEAMAKEILEAMEANGFMTSDMLTVPGKKEQFKQYYFGDNVSLEIRNMMREMGPARSIIEMAGLKAEDRNGPTYNTPPKAVARTQMRNKAVNNTKVQRDVIRKAQSIAHTFYQNSYDMQRAIGIDAWISLMGSTVIDAKKPFNEEHKKSVKGKNLTMSMAFDAMEQQYAELQAQAGDNNIEDIKKYYPFNYSRVNRLQMLGVNTPQSDKIARHVFLPTKTTIDMTDDASDASVGFWMAAAQGLGVKTQHFTREENAQQGRDFLENSPLSPLVQDLQTWLNNGKQGSLSDWSNRLREVEPGITEHGVMTMLSLAEYANARDAGTLKSFTTHNYFEADGVTNGPANALMNLSTTVTPAWLDAVRRAGSFIGMPNTAMNSQKGKNDLYQEASNRLAVMQKDFVNTLPDDVKAVHDSLFRIMRGLGMKISINNDGDIEINRKVLKNPLTITIYGSGVDGIAGNVASEIMDNFYEALSEHLQSGKNTPFGEDMVYDGQPYSAEAFWEDLGSVLQNRVSKKDNEFSIIPAQFIKKLGIPSNENLKNMAINSNEFKVLQDNVRALFVDNMNGAIDSSVMEPIKSMVSDIQKATNAQSILMTYMFRKEVLRAMADRQLNPSKYPNYRRGDFLSQNELDDILTRLMPYGAVINTDYQSYFLGAGERSNLMSSQEIKIGDQTIKVSMPESFSRSLTDQLKTAAYAYAPSPAGVAGVPSFNIGTGDGRMIDVFLQGLKGFGVLPVFDGINIPVDRITEGSKMANSAVMQSWSENPAKHVSESFQAFLALNPYEQMFDTTDPFNVEIDQLANELTKNIKGVRTPAEALPLGDIMLLTDDLNTRLKVGQQLIGDRIEATKAMPMSVDQMAGGQSPYTQEGTVALPINPSSAQIATALQHQIRVVRATRTKGEIISAPSRDFVSAFRSKAGTDPDTGALIADVNALNAIRKTLNNKLSNVQREMLNASLQNLTDSGLQVVFGTPDMVDRYEQNNYPQTYLPENDAFMGKIDVDNNVIYLTNPSTETLAHELIHAATITKMQGYYSNKGSVSVADGEAIDRLEGLMKEWLSRSYEREGPVVGEAHRMAVSSIMNFLNQGRMPEALNEFLAWSLTNQNIINLQKKMQVQNPLFRIMGQALTALKQLIWGHKKAPDVGTDMFSNVRFNAKVLMATPTPIELFMKDFGEVVLFQSSSFGSDPRLSQMRNTMWGHIKTFIQTDQFALLGAKEQLIQRQARMNAAQDALIQNQRIADQMASAFHMNMQEISTFKMIGATLGTAEHLNTASLARLNDVYSSVIDQLTVEDFLHNDGRDPEADRYEAQQKYNAILGVGFDQIDKKGRSKQLSNFVAMANVNPEFREILRKMKFAPRIMDKSWKADALFDRAAAAIASGMANYASGAGKQDNDFQAAIDALTKNLVDNVGDQRSFIEQRIDNGLDSSDNLIRSYVERTAKKAEQWADTLKSPLGKKASSFLKILSKSMTSEGTDIVNNTTLQAVNQPQILNAQREAVAEIIGRTSENAPVFDMITKTRTMVDQTRQRWREEFPKELRARFSKKLSDEQWADLHSMAKTDAASLFKDYRRDRSIELLSLGSERKAEIRKLEAGLSDVVKTKAKQLADFMNTGLAGPQLQRNAHAIAVLNNAKDNESQINNLVSLYALDSLPQQAIDTIENLARDEKEGFSAVYLSLVSTYNDEQTKNSTPLAQMNHYKGKLDGNNQDGLHLVIDTRQKYGDYINMGYVLLADYKGSTADVGTVPKSYYFAPVSGKAKYNQGVMQTVQPSVFGVNPDSGMTVGGVRAGSITDPRAVNAITRRIGNQQATRENLMPVYAENGRIIAYERAADPNLLTHLNPEYDLATAMGSWRGRQSEEKTAQFVNEELVDKVYDIWKDGRQRLRTNEYVDMSKSTDPIIADAWSLIPRQTKEYIKDKFGTDGFRVRRDMLLDVAGARSASVGDFWTGNSRWNDVTQKEIRDLLVGFVGTSAYRKLVNAESTLQQVITDAKVLIVIKSVVVPAANFVSNIYQLSMNGVPIRHIFKGFKEKSYELNTYIKNRETQRQLDNDLFVAEGANDSVQIRKLSSRIQALKDSYKSLSIWPLLEAGEFGAITEGGISVEDLAIGKGGYAALIEKTVNKIPDNGLRDVARYGMITRDTALFKALSRATQYGDFLGKAILYDDLLRRKKISQEEALAYVSEEFVNYNRFPGRNRAYLESVGLTWFYNFKLRSMKVAQRMMQNHPVRALLHTAMTPRLPFLGSVGNPMTDSMFSVIFDGRLGYSTGPGMIFRAPQLNPWMSMIE